MSVKHKSNSNSDNFDYAAAVNFLKERKNRQKKKNSILFQQALKDASSILELIIRKYNPVRIYQWGSLLDEESFSEISDIDIALEGIVEPETFFNLYKDVESMTDFSLDIVQLEKIEPEFSEIIKMKGEMVYERKQ